MAQFGQRYGRNEEKIFYTDMRVAFCCVKGNMNMDQILFQSVNKSFGNIDAIRKICGVLSEDVGLYEPLSVYDNLIYYASIYKMKL